MDISKDYKAPFLFKDFERCSTSIQQRSYIEKELVRMAKHGTLCLTDLYCQRHPVGQVCGEIILGQQIVGGVQTSIDVPVELEQYTVSLKSYNRKHSIGYKMPAKFTDYSNQLSGGNVFSGDIDAAAKHRKMEQVYVDTGKEQAELPLKYAWRALRKNGAFCARAKGIKQREKNWLFYEVMPDVQPIIVDETKPVTPDEIALLKAELAKLQGQIQQNMDSKGKLAEAEKTIGELKQSRTRVKNEQPVDEKKSRWGRGKKG